VEWVKDEAGRWKIEEVPDSEKIYPCQVSTPQTVFIVVADSTDSPDQSFRSSQKIASSAGAYPSVPITGFGKLRPHLQVLDWTERACQEELTLQLCPER